MNSMDDPASFDPMSTVRTFALHARAFEVQREITWPFANPLEIEVVEMHTAMQTARYAIRALVRIAVQEEQMAQYPATWWDAVKARFAPEWFTRRWPVQYTRIIMEVLYPRVAFPREKHVIHLHTVDPKWN
jgi:hypothetical protein